MSYMCAPTCLIMVRPISCPAGMQEAASAASKGAPRAEGFELDLVGSQGAWVASSTLLLGLASGQLVAVNLQIDGGSVKRIKVCLSQPCTLTRAGSLQLTLLPIFCDDVCAYVHHEGSL